MPPLEALPDMDDRSLLAFAAEHRFVLAAHAAALLGVTESAARERLLEHCAAGLLVAKRVFDGHPSMYRITRDGLRTVGSSLRAPNIDLSRYDHEVGVAWLWLAARNGAFGPMRSVLGERRLRSRDGTAAAAGEPLAVRLGATGWAGKERLHYPDVLLVDARGRRIAVELELSSKGRGRREKILGGYAADARFAAVLYVVESPQLARSIEASAARLAIPWLVRLQRVRWSTATPRACEGGARLRAAAVAPRAARTVVGAEL